MDLSQRKEQFSEAYLRAVAAVAGFALAKPIPDDDSVDYTISARGSAGLARRPKLDVQLKATAQRGVLQEDDLRFTLTIKNYDDLRPVDLVAPRVLIVVVLPEELDDWVSQTEQALCLRRCAYWRSLRGEPPTENSTGVTVSIPRTQVFSPGALQEMMTRINAGTAP